MGVTEVTPSKQTVTLVGGRAVSSSFAEISITDSGWTDLLASFTNVSVLSIQNKSGVDIKLNSDNAEVDYKGMTVSTDGERHYNDLDTGFAMFAKSSSGNVSLNVEVLKDA